MEKENRIKRAVTDAQRRAVHKHDTEVVDRVTVRLPKGAKKAITAKGISANAFIIAATMEKMKREGIKIE